MAIPRWLWIPAAGVAALATVLCFVPLFDLLAYEFSFALGLLTAVTGLALGLGAGRRAARGLAALGLALAAALAHLAPALAIVGLNTLRVPNCNFGEGLAFFALLPGGNALYGAALGVLIARGFGPNARRAPLYAAALALVVPLAWTLWALYREPPIFAFDHLWGHFAGSLYDEVIRIDGRLLLFRLGTALRIAIVALLLSVADRGRLRPLVAVLAIGLLAVFAYERLVGRRAGFRVGRDDILAELSVVEMRPGVVVHLPPGLDAARRRAIADDHAFRLEQIRARLAIDEIPTLHSFVYRDATQKGRLMGGRGTMVAKPWLFEVHLHDAVAPHPVLAHELVHVVAAALAKGPLHVSSRYGVMVNMGLVEGLAEALTATRGELDVDRSSRALRAIGFAPDVRALFGSAGFWSAAPRRAYTLAGSFVRHLLRTRGASALHRAYAHGDFESAYGMSLDDLAAEWERYVDAIDLSPHELQRAREQFKTPSIFGRICAHEIASLGAEAARSDPERAVTLRERIVGFLGDDPTARLELALALRRAGQDEAFAREAAALLDDPRLTTAERTQLLEAEGDERWARGERDLASVLFERALAARPGAASERRLWVRLWALSSPATIGDALRRLLGGDLDPLAAAVALTEARREQPADKTLPYLLARQLERVGACDQALPLLEAATAHPFPPIEAERVRLLALCRSKIGELEAAEASYRLYAELTAGSGEAERAYDEVERLRWRARRELATRGPNEASAPALGEDGSAAADGRDADGPPR